MLYKDAILDELADKANVAQFVSFAPAGKQRFCRIYAHEPNHTFRAPAVAIEALLKASPEASVNVRSFRPDQPQGNEFHYGLKTVEEAVAHVERLASAGFHTIVNETVDVNDGGVSGVLLGGCMEFASGTVPRFVEKAADNPIPALPRDLAMKLFETIYGFTPALDHYKEGYRVEFSIHPKPRGWQRSHTIIWEEEQVVESPIEPFFSWPNPFSRLLGDKAYGLLMAHLLGQDVPRCTVFPRDPRVSIFTFGTPTGTAAHWTRTCPKVQEPGRFSTLRGWHDPYDLMSKDDPTGEYLASCIVQEEVASIYSGALITGADDNIIFEGTTGFGDDFMLGGKPEDNIPDTIASAYMGVYRNLRETLGPVRFEWAYDGVKTWVLQLHKGASISYGRTICPGEPKEWTDYYVGEGLGALRALIEKVLVRKAGVRVHGHVGMSSHIADLLRKARVPSVMADS